MVSTDVLSKGENFNGDAEVKFKNKFELLIHKFVTQIIKHI